MSMSNKSWLTDRMKQTVSILESFRRQNLMFSTWTPSLQIRASNWLRLEQDMKAQILK